jgi:hypothetical protein
MESKPFLDSDYQNGTMVSARCQPNPRPNSYLGGWEDWDRGWSVLSFGFRIDRTRFFQIPIYRNQSRDARGGSVTLGWWARVGKSQRLSSR